MNNSEKLTLRLLGDGLQYVQSPLPLCAVETSTAVEVNDSMLIKTSN